MRHKIDFRIPRTEWRFFYGANLMFYRDRTHRTAGTLNRTLDNHFVFYADYDRLAYPFLVMEANYLQREFKLSDWHLFYCKDHKEGWHAVTLDKLLFWENFDVLKESCCDSKYKFGCFYTPAKCWTLRLLEKGDRDRVEYYGVIPSDYHEREKSRAHAELIEAFGAKIDWDKGKFDNYHMTDIEIFEGVKLPSGKTDKVEVGGITTEAYNTASHISKDSLKKELDKR
jgi:hypothetical protein